MKNRQTTTAGNPEEDDSEDGNSKDFSGLLADGLREGISVGAMQSRYEKRFTEPPRPYTEDICCERRLWIAQTKERSSA